MKALSEVDIDTIDFEPPQFHYSSKAVVAGGMVHDAMTVGTVLDSGSGIIFTSKMLVADGAALSW